MSDNGIRTYRVPKKDRRVEAVVLHLARISEWPVWFAKNVVLWRKRNGYQWERWSEPKEVRL